jgi:hypothetical protein
MGYYLSQYGSCLAGGKFIIFDFSIPNLFDFSVVKGVGLGYRR